MEEKDYKKLYEDVLERAKNGLKDKNYYLSQSAKEVTEFLFPQLKETEDEKVKRELTRFLINFNNGYYSKPSENEIDSWIKWINKKCEQNHTDEVKPKFNVGDWVVNKLGHVWHINGFDKKNYQVSNGDKYNYFPISKQDEMHLWTINDAEDGDVLYTSSTASNEVFIFKGLTKEGYIDCYCSYDSEDKYCEGKHHFIGEPTFMTHPAAKEKCDLLFQKMKEAGYEWDADKKELKNINQNPVNSYCQENCKGFQESGKCFADWDCKVKREAEHKLVDKVEPKFKVGDWVRAISSGNIFKILSFNDGLYRVLCYDGVEANYPIEDVDYDLAYWTIQDAKDGDVLATKKGNPFIYDKNRYNNGLAYYYAGLDVNKELTLKSPHHMLAHFGELSGVFPATKEQRDILFQKMKEAGYEWNAEKKELRKIEQNNSWSEDDEKMLNDILMCGEHHCYLDDGNIAWLKSLKDRVQPQPKKEWSKEDSERLLRIHQFIWANRKGDTDEIYQQEQDADWIMSLNPQQNNYDKGYNDGYSAAKYNQWKPTDKQMEDFRMLLDYNIGVFDYSKFMSADSLYDDLKKNLIDE